MRTGEYFSKGKFLISGEYLVLHGAKALAVPLKLGQRMLVKELPGPGKIRWDTYVLEKLWFSASYDPGDIGILDSSDESTAVFIQNLLKEGGKMRPALHDSTSGYHVQNYIDFDISWGLGSSSSLVSNLAYWFDIDPYALYRSAFRGSGYDVFCARAVKPIIYQLKANCPVVMESTFNPVFTENLYFVYSGRKQDSQESVKNFMAQKDFKGKIIDDISDLTYSMLNANCLGDFLRLMRLHEEILSDFLGLPMVKQELFPDFRGEIKSLGAWGGDFFMAGTSMSHDETREYFLRKNLPVVFKWDEIVY